MTKKNFSELLKNHLLMYGLNGSPSDRFLRGRDNGSCKRGQDGCKNHPPR